MEQVSTAGLRPEVRLLDNAPPPPSGSQHVTSTFHGVWPEWEGVGGCQRGHGLLAQGPHTQIRTGARPVIKGSQAGGL